MGLKGVKLKDRYVIDEELKPGGFGLVYLAHDTDLLSRPVVIKTLLENPRWVNDPWLREKFNAEIKALVRINHPAVVGVFDVGQMPDGKPFFVMQYVEGENLRSVMRNQGMELKRVAHIIRQLGYALSAAHDAGITHRDIKPENVMVRTLKSGEEIVKLIDFGIATVKDFQASQIDQTTRIAGTVPYIAPEQLQGKPIPASDIWSLGVLAYEMITGCLPFQTDNFLKLAELQRAGVGALPKALRPELPTNAQEVILKALSYESTDRYKHAHYMGEALKDSLINADVQSFSTDAQPPDGLSEMRTSEPAYVLFMDMVDYPTLPIGEQVERTHQLLNVVRNAPAFQRARSDNHLIRQPTSNGMTLVFFQNPLAPVQCALEIADGLKAYPDVKLRMGIHCGPVYRLLDINENLNVKGSGIDVAQSVMEAGDAGHILLSLSIAETLIQLGNWHQHLHDIGEHEVKHGVSVRLFNLYKENLGSPNWPSRLERHDSSYSRLPRAELLQRCRELFEDLDEFRHPIPLRDFLNTHELQVYKQCVQWSSSLDFDHLIACLNRSGRHYKGQALVELLDALANRYKHDYRRTEFEELRDSLKP